MTKLYRHRKRIRENEDNAQLCGMEWYYDKDNFINKAMNEAIKTLFKTEKEVKNILYIDLDVHQGNGPETDFFHDKRVFIFDVYNKFIFPFDDSVKKRIDRRVELGFHVGDKEYLTKLKLGLKEILNTHKLAYSFPSLHSVKVKWFVPC